MAGARKRSGGRRPGSGRRSPAGAPKPPKHKLPWADIKRAADDGAEEPELIRAFAIPEEALSDPVVLGQLRAEIQRGHARYALELRAAIRKRGLRTAKTAGSVNALALQARNRLDWDKQLPPQETEPDIATARQRLRDLFVKLAEARSEIEGRVVTALELLHREAQSEQPDAGR